MFWKWIRRVGLGLVSFFTLLLFTGAAYQYICTKIDERTYFPPGCLVDVGGFKLHYQTKGKGGPVVVLDAGLGCMSSDWGIVQKEIAKFTQVVSYDRAGMGWSELSPYPRTSAQIVKELHTLLKNAGIPGPYILVGHSFGGHNMQLFAATYPDEVIGLVLVDSCHEAQEKKIIPNPLETQMKLMQNPKIVFCLYNFGLIRLLANLYLKTYMPQLPELMQEIHLALAATSKHGYAMANEISHLGESLSQLAKVDRSQIRHKPCYVLTAGCETNLMKFGISRDQQKRMREIQAVWNDLQSDLVTRYTNSHHFVAERSDHMIPWNQPELIIRSVRELIKLHSQPILVID